MGLIDKKKLLREVQQDKILKHILTKDIENASEIRQHYYELSYLLPLRRKSKSQYYSEEEHLDESEGGHPLPLFDYQAEIYDQFTESIKKKHSGEKALISLPTGGGKTRTAVSAVLHLFSVGLVARAIWIAPSLELLEQAIDTFKKIKQSVLSPNLYLHRAYAQSTLSKRTSNLVEFATPQMLHHKVRSKSLHQQYDLVVFDEAHMLGAKTYAGVINELSTNNNYVVGLSATPGRTNQKETSELISLFERRMITSLSLGQNPLEALREKSVLSKIIFKKITETNIRKFPIVKREDIGVSPKDYYLYNKNRFNRIITLIEQKQMSKSLVFAGSIKYANAISAYLSANGVKNGVITSYTPEDERRDTLNNFKNGDINILINKSILSTGYDCPAINNVIITHPITSAILYEQIIGRGSRGSAVGGSDKSYLFEVDQNFELHGEPASYMRYSLDTWNE